MECSLRSFGLGVRPQGTVHKGRFCPGCALPHVGYPLEAAAPHSPSGSPPAGCVFCPLLCSQNVTAERPVLHVSPCFFGIDVQKWHCPSQGKSVPAMSCGMRGAACSPPPRPAVCCQTWTWANLISEPWDLGLISVSISFLLSFSS